MCVYHYGVWYRHLNPSHLKCKACNKHIPDVTKGRTIPEPQLIQNFLSANNDFHDLVSSHDRICYTCYTSYLILIEHIMNSVQSIDADLTALIDKLKSNLPSTSDIKTPEVILSYASSLSAIKVGDAVLKKLLFFCLRCMRVLKPKW